MFKNITDQKENGWLDRISSIKALDMIIIMKKRVYNIITLSQTLTRILLTFMITINIFVLKYIFVRI